MTDRRHIAIHEAGHAVIGRVLTMACGGATIVPDDELGSEGHAVIADVETTIRQWEMREKFRDYVSAVRGRIIAIQAGHEAEAELLGRAAGDDEDDRICAAALIEDAGIAADREGRSLLRLREAARALVRRHRGAIERVAAALSERGALTGDEIDAMLPPGFMARPATWAFALRDGSTDAPVP